MKRKYKKTIQDLLKLHIRVEIYPPACSEYSRDFLYIINDKLTTMYRDFFPDRFTGFKENAIAFITVFGIIGIIFLTALLVIYGWVILIAC